MTDRLAGSAVGGPSCSSRIPIVPIRYAVLPDGPGGALYKYGASEFNLEKGFPALKEACYTLRSLRPGYVYVYMKGTVKETLVIHEHEGKGFFKELRYTGLENYEKRDKYIEDKPKPWVWADTCPETATEVWIGFSTHLWTNRMTQNVYSAAWRAIHMQRLDVAELTNGIKSYSTQKHVLPSEALSQWVEDYKPKDQRLPLEWSSYSLEGTHLPVSTIIAEGKNYRWSQPKVPAVLALYDAEGITLDLGLISSVRQHQIFDVQNRTVSNAAQNFPSCMQLDVEKLAMASQEFHYKNMIAIMLEQTLRLMYSSGPVPELNSGIQLYQQLTDEDHSPGGARLAERLDSRKYFEFLRVRQQADKELQDLLTRRDVACANHDLWLATMETSHRSDPKSVIAVLDLYDRDNIESAYGLEQVIALLMHGMGLPMPGREDMDIRFARLNRWIDDETSPVYMALASYNPFKEAAGSISGLLSSADETLGALFGRFPSLADGPTNLIAQDVLVVTMHRLKGKTRWTKSPTLRGQVLIAAQEANMQKVLGLLAARYKILNSNTSSNPLTREVQNLIDEGLAKITQTTEVDVQGSRTVTVKRTQTIKVKPTLKGLGLTGLSDALNVGMLYFNIIALQHAYQKLRSECSTVAVINYASALLGIISSLAWAGSTGRGVVVKAFQNSGIRLPGMAFGSSIGRILAGKSFGRLLGWPGILMGVATDSYTGYQQYQAGGTAAARYTWGGGLSIAIGGALMLEGGIALTAAMTGVGAAAGASATIPVAGWIAAAVILVGGGLIVLGIWLHSKAAGKKHTLLELWAARSVFGNRINDGEVRSGVILDARKRLPPYSGLQEEIQGWYDGYFSPVALDSSQAESLGWEGVETDWDDNLFSPDEAKFALLLPGFTEGQSIWSGKMYTKHKEIVLTDENTQCKMVQAGLMLYVPYTVRSGDGSSIRLETNYYPNQGWDENIHIIHKHTLYD